MERKLLWVDDNQEILDLLPIMFPDFSVVTARSVPEGLEKLVRERPGFGVIVADYHLVGEATGVQLLSEAQNRMPLSSRYLCTASGTHAMEEMAGRGIGLGEMDLALSLFDKPITADRLVAAITAGFERYERLTNSAIVMVDDDPMVLRALARVASKVGCTIKQYGSSPEAAAYIRNYTADPRNAQAPIAVVLSDTLMPEMDGTQVVRIAKRANPQIRPIIISGTTCTEENSRLYAALRSDIGDFPIVQKPFDNDQLQALLAREVISYHAQK